jgi:hypothetical protein
VECDDLRSADLELQKEHGRTPGGRGTADQRRGATERYRRSPKRVVAGVSQSDRKAGCGSRIYGAAVRS